MKRPHFYYFVYIFLSFVFYTSAFACQQALYEHLSLCSRNDFELIANLLFFSHQRSIATCTMQTASFSAMKTFHAIQDNIETTRKNPSITYPHMLNTTEIKATQEKYLERYAFYCSTIACYKHSANTLLVDRQNLFETPSSLGILNNLRHQARIAISAALGYHFITLQNVYTTLQQQWLTKSGELIPCEESHVKTITALINTLSSAIPYVGVQAFSYFDRQTCLLTEQARTLLVNATELHNFLWNTIETARTVFYKDLCITVLRCLHERGFKNCCYLRFDEHGIITSPTTLLLPHLEQWIS